MSLRSVIRTIALLALSGCIIAPAAGQPHGDTVQVSDLPSPSPDEDARLSSVRDVLSGAGFVGRVGFEDGDGVFHFAPVGFEPAEASPPLALAWPWASVTKQVIAVMVMQDVEAGRIDLNTPASVYLPQLASGGPTVEQLLRHQSNLANPEDTEANSSGVPDFYLSDYDMLEFCTGQSAGTPTDGGWRYNNCDYIVLGALLEAVNNEDIDTLIANRIAQPVGWTGTSRLLSGETREFVGATPEYQRIARYGSSAALVGPILDMLLFDRALLDGELLGDQARAELWDGDPALGYMALGQWVFDAPISGCDGTVRIVERRGGIGKYQIRNIILPDQNIVLALVTGEAGFEFGEIWTGVGPMHDVLSAIACN